MGTTSFSTRFLFSEGLVIPTYSYKCSNCGHKFDKFQSMTSRILRKCPSCKKFNLNRLIGTGSALIFKGSGFYETDYNRSKDYKKKKNKEIKNK